MSGREIIYELETLGADLTCTAINLELLNVKAEEIEITDTSLAIWSVIRQLKFLVTEVEALRDSIPPT